MVARNRVCFGTSEVQFDLSERSVPTDVKQPAPFKVPSLWSHCPESHIHASSTQKIFEITAQLAIWDANLSKRKLRKNAHDSMRSEQVQLAVLRRLFHQPGSSAVHVATRYSERLLRSRALEAQRHDGFDAVCRDAATQLAYG